MPAPLIMGAAAVAARLAAKKAASNVVKKAATKKLVQEAAKRKPLATPKSNVKVKPAAKQVGNPPNSAKTLEGVASSHYRTWNPFTGIEEGVRSAGKSQAARVAGSKKPTASGNASKKPAPARTPARTPANPAKNTVIVNSAKTVRRIKVGPKKK
jgi:hypothetical protein